MIPSLTLFVHVVGMLTLFVGLGLEWASLGCLQRSLTREQALPWLRLVVSTEVTIPAAQKMCGWPKSRGDARECGPMARNI
jgi:hypothetical protein